MNPLQSLVVALDMLRQHKLRSFLTMLGVIIGVMSVTIIVMLSEGFKSYLKDQFAKIGSDTIFLFYQPTDLQQGESVGGVEGLTLEDVDYIRDRCNLITLLSAYREAGRVDLRQGEKKKKSVKAVAIDANYMELNRVKLIKGRHIGQADVDAKASVVVISESVASALFDKADPIGQYILTPDMTLQVIGVSEKLDMMGERNPDVLFLPLSSANSKWLGGDQIDLILMRSVADRPIDDALEQVWRAMMAKSGNRAIYRVESSENVLKIFSGIVGTAGAALAGIAALSLLVGGIGIMNIMLVSVTERTREIGLRKAIGAKRPAILTQFLIEAATLSLIGGLIGMGIAYLLGLAATAATAKMGFPDKNGLQATFPIAAAIAASGFSAFIGMVFGFFPAMTASRLDPIVALRHE